MSDVQRAGVVASGHRAVSEAAAAMLRAGGNAFDAIVAAGFASSVAEAAFTSLGGGGFLLAVEGGRARLFDFFSDTPGKGARAPAEPHFEPVVVRFPSADQTFHVGLGSVAVPGVLKGLVHVHARLGRMPLADVLAPAIALARDGVPLTAFGCSLIELLWPIFTLTEGARAVFAPDGKQPVAGEKLALCDLARFLEELPRGALDSFYRGEIAARIERDLAAGGGALTRADLASYAVVEREPLEVRYRGARVLLNPPPAGGGVAVARLLKLYSSVDPSELSFASPAHVRALAATMREGERLRSVPLDDDEAHESAGAAVRSFSRGTTHVSVADAAGNVAAMTTSNGEGSGYVAPGTGIMLNNMMGEDDLHPGGWHRDEPGQRISSMMCPLVVVDDEGARLVLGSGGSKRIRTALFQVLTHVLDLGLPLDDAVRAPRVHWDGAALQVEPGLPSAVLDALARDFLVNQWHERDLYFGGVHAVDARAGGVGDPRREGHALVVER